MSRCTVSPSRVIDLILEMDFDDVPFNFFVRVWKGDRAVTALSPAARGIWFELLCNMHELDHRGVITGTREVLARDGRCSDRQLNDALAEIKLFNVAEITERNGLVTLVNRRMKKAAESRESGRKRVQRCRRNGNVTPDVTPDVTPLKRSPPPVPLPIKLQSDKALSLLSLDRGGSKGGKLSPRLVTLALLMEGVLGVQWANDAGKWINRLKSNPEKFERVVNEVGSASKEGRIRTTPAQYAHQIWSEFAS